MNLRAVRHVIYALTVCVCVLAFVAGAVITAATRVPPVPQVPRVTLTWGAMRVEVGP